MKYIHGFIYSIQKQWRGTKFCPQLTLSIVSLFFCSAIMPETAFLSFVFFLFFFFKISALSLSNKVHPFFFPHICSFTQARGHFWLNMYFVYSEEKKIKDLFILPFYLWQKLMSICFHGSTEGKKTPSLSFKECQQIMASEKLLACCAPASQNDFVINKFISASYHYSVKRLRWSRVTH